MNISIHICFTLATGCAYALYIYMCICICVYIYIYMHVYICICMYVCMYVYMRICMDVYICEVKIAFIIARKERMYQFCLELSRCSLLCSPK